MEPMTPVFRQDEVRQKLTEQVELLNGFKAARLFYAGGITNQGAQFGDRTFDIVWGETTPLSSDKVSVYVKTVFTVRLLHKALIKDSAEGTKLLAEDAVVVKNQLLNRGLKLPDAIQRTWLKTGKPTPLGKGEFIQTDIEIECRYYEWRSGTPDAQGSAP